MLFCKKLTCLLLLLSVSCGSMHAMESVSTKCRSKETEIGQPGQVPLATPVVQPTEETGQKAPSIPAQPATPPEPQTPTPATETLEKKESKPSSTEAPQAITPPQTTAPTLQSTPPVDEQSKLDAKKVEEIVDGQPLPDLTQEAVIKCPSYDYIHGNIVPSLRQNGAYCGYYALFNARLMLNKKIISKENRDECCKEFKEFLRQQLKQSVVITGWRDAEEVRKLLGPDDDNILVMDPTSFFVAVANEANINIFLKQIKNNEELPGIDNRSFALRNFKNKSIDQISLIAFVGNDHWIAIHAERQRDSILLKIADSNNGIRCATDPASLKKYILPFYYALTQPFEEWQKLFTAEYFKELDEGAQDRALKQNEHPKEAKKDTESAQQQKTGPSSSALTQEGKSLSEQAVQKACEKALSKSLWLSPDQSIALHSLVLKIEEIMDKAQELQELLKQKDKPDTTVIENAVGELLKIEAVDYKGQATFVEQLLNSGVHRSNKDLKGMLDKVASILQNLENFYAQLRDYQQTKEDKKLTELLKKIVPFYVPIKQKLLDAIELSSLLLELPRKSVHDATKTTPATPPSQPSRLEVKYEPNTLHKAALEDNRAEILKLVDTDHKPVNGLNEQGMSPLHIACLRHNTETISVLLEKNADTNLYSNTGLTPLHYALLEKCSDKNRQLSIVGALLRTADINATACSNFWFSSFREPSEFNGWTALHFASRLGHEGIVETLLNHQALVNAVSHTNETALYIAASMGFASIVRILLDNGADIALGKSPLEIAIEKGFNDVVAVLFGIKNPSEQSTWRSIVFTGAIVGGRTILKKVAPKILTKVVPIISSIPPLIGAGKAIVDYRRMKISGFKATGKVAYGVISAIPNPANIVVGITKDSVEIGKGLYDLFSNPDNPIKNKFSRLSVLYASRRNLENHQAVLEITQLLFSQLCEKDKQEWANYLMPYAVRTDQNIDIITLLIDYGADVTEGLAAALNANDNEDCLRLLLAKGAKLDNISRQLVARHYWLNNPIHEVVDSRDTARLEKLLELTRYSPNAIDQHNTMPVHIAAANGDLALITSLKNKLATSRVANDFGLVPLHCAAVNGRIPVLSYFLGLGAEEKTATINAPNIHDLTPLHAAIIGGHTEAVSRLLEQGADAAKINKRGKAPLILAIEKGHQEIVKLLLEKVALKDFGSSLEQAASRGQDEIVKQLLEKHAKITEQAVKAATKEVVKQLREKHAVNTEQAVKAATKNGHESTAKILTDWRDLVSNTVAEHQHGSWAADPATEPISKFDGHWKIVPSLQQTCPSGKQPLMDGYYALYNAACFIKNEEAKMRDIGHFCESLHGDLELINNNRQRGTVENLELAELNLLIANRCKQLPDKQFPIIAIEKRALFAFLSQPDIGLDKALGVSSDMNYLGKFINKEIDKFAIIAGIGTQVSHWFTIFVERINGTINLKIADSATKISNWDSDRINSSILPFYLAANDSLCDNKADILYELFSEFKEQSLEDLTPAAQHLEFFIDCIKNLKTSLSAYLESGMPEHVSENQRILTNIRSCKFSLAVGRLLPKILAQSIKIKAQDPLGDEIISFYKSVRKNVDSLGKEIEGINQVTKQNTEGSESKRMQPEEVASKQPAASGMVSAIYGWMRAKAPAFFAKNATEPSNQSSANQGFSEPIDVKKDVRMDTVVSIVIMLRSLEKAASDIFDKMNKAPVQNKSMVLAIDDESFVSHVTDLKPKFLKLIQQSLPDAIIGMIGQLTKEIHDPVRALFVGPPGNGKTTIAQVIAQTCHRPFHFVRAASLGNSYQFSRENQINSLITYMEKNPNAIILLDELDALAEFTNSPQRAAEQLQSIIDLARKEYPKVVFIGTTNYKDKIPAPLLSRFPQNTIEIPNPTVERRDAIIHYHVQRLEKNGLQFNLETDYLKNLAAKTESFSIRDLESLFENVQGQISIQVGREILQTTGTAISPDQHQSNQPNIITSASMQQAYQAILATIVQPSKTEHLLAAATKYGPLLPYIGHAISIASLGLSMYSTYKSGVHHTEDIDRQKENIRDSNARQDKQRAQDHEDLQKRTQDEALKVVSLERAHAVIRQHEEHPITNFVNGRRGLDTEPKLFYYNGQYIAITDEQAKQNANKLQVFLEELKSIPGYTPQKGEKLEKLLQQQIDHFNGKK